MSKILLPDAPNFGKKPEQPKMKATIIFQDANYTFMRNKEVLTQEDVFNVPLHLFLITLGMLDANQYVPRVGKKSFVQTLDKLKTQFNRVYKTQKTIAENMKEDKK